MSGVDKKLTEEEEMTHPALRGLAALSLSTGEHIEGRKGGGRERALGDKSEKRKKKRPRQIATDSASEEERAGGRETRGMNRVSQNRVDYELALEPTPPQLWEENESRNFI